MRRTYELIVETSDHPAEPPYLVTLWDQSRGVIVAQRASSLEVCLAPVVGRVIADDGPVGNKISRINDV
jgi:hypothetical protein